MITCKCKNYVVPLIITFLLFPLVALAENIDPDNDGSQYAWGENVGWINFEPEQGEGVTVTNSALTGKAWGENIGWINLSPATGGVSNDGAGNLSGYAWGENIGWISFSCENTGICNSLNYGVTINPATGAFSGKAWGENIGWINFAPDGKPVKTSWRGPGSCGDGIVGNSPGETCDPPGQPGPGLQPGICRQGCTYCGDGQVNNGESCDDGNGINGDGCENDCTIPSVTCSFTPVATPPIRIMRGGILRFRVDIYNNENTTQSFKFATKVKLPSGNMYPNFLIGPAPIILNANSSKGGNSQMTIPLNAPFGTYTYYGYVGVDSPVVKYDECQFSFTVVQ